MQIQSKFFLFVLIIAFATIIVSMFKSKHFCSALILSSIQGVSSLFAVNILASITGISLAVNYLSIAISSVFGLSGTIMLLVLNLIVS